MGCVEFFLSWLWRVIKYSLLALLLVVCFVAWAKLGLIITEHYASERFYDAVAGFFLNFKMHFHINVLVFLSRDKFYLLLRVYVLYWKILTLLFLFGFWQCPIWRRAGWWIFLCIALLVPVLVLMMPYGWKLIAPIVGLPRKLYSRFRK